MIDRVLRVEQIPRVGETVAALDSCIYPGGKGANQAVAAARCGAQVRMYGRTGMDGCFIVEELARAGVDVRAIETTDALSGTAVVLVTASGENSIIISPEANTRIEMSKVEQFLSHAQSGEFALFQNECAHRDGGIAHAHARGLRVWLNAAPAICNYPTLFLSMLEGLIVNETEAHALTGERRPKRALEALAARMPHGTVIITLGASGSIACSRGTVFNHCGFKVQAVDTVGCGDAFIGALLASISEGQEMADAINFANAAGALAATRPGAMASLPTKAEVGALLATKI